MTPDALIALADAGTPFVLLDDARPAAAVPARLYRDPLQIVATRRCGEVASALDALRIAARGGLHAAGYLSYDAGTVAPDKAPDHDERVLWFGLFRDFAPIDSRTVERSLPDPRGGWVGAPGPLIAQPHYEAVLARIQALIAAGDVYQINFTFPAQALAAGHPLAIYAGLRERARAGHGAVVFTGREWILSLSPELFFALDGSALTTRPMKGTAARDGDPARDRSAADMLGSDDKQRAENLMIVDLLRNDLARVAEPGSVTVPELYRIESYPTLHQMTSTVTARIADGRDAIDALAALFPCGSITGTPKVRAMEIIAEVEDRARGVYTGAIGRIDAGAQSAAFNVAIRTLVLDASGASATIGLGSGVVADSRPHSEWAECLAKGAFVASPHRFDLIETMAFDSLTGVARLERHLARMKASAETLGFEFDRHAARNELQAATFRLREPRRLRLMLGRSGAMAIEVGPIPAVPDAPVPIVVVPLPVDAHDFRLRHKTSDRRFYDAARRGHFEVIFALPDGRLSEGSFTNLFVERDGRLLTPPRVTGLLGGILREELIAEGRAHEADLRINDLAAGFLIGNSLRGLLPARLAAV